MEIKASGWRVMIDVPQGRPLPMAAVVSMSIRRVRIDCSAGWLWGVNGTCTCCARGRGVLVCCRCAVVARVCYEQGGGGEAPRGSDRYKLQMTCPARARSQAWSTHTDRAGWVSQQSSFCNQLRGVSLVPFEDPRR